MIVYNLMSPYSTQETAEVISTAMERIGKIKEINARSGSIKATHRDKNWNKRKLNFFIERAEKDCKVRMVMSDSCLDTKYVWKQRDGVWDDFLKQLFELMPNVDFGITLSEGSPYVVGAIFVGDDIEQVHISKTKNNPSVARFIIGGLMFGTAGAVVGGLSGTSKTTGRTFNQISAYQLVRIIYNNGRVWEGAISKNSDLYNEIMVNLETLSIEK